MELLLYLLVGGMGSFLLPAAVLIAAFVIVRSRRDEPVDLATGAGAYVALILAGSAIVATIGLARVLTGVLGTFDLEYTYGGSAGQDSFPFSDAGPGSPDDYNNRDAAAGLALLMVGGVVGLVHLGVRSRLRLSGRFDAGAERAVEVSVLIASGLGAVGLLGNAAQQVIEREMVSSAHPSPGGAVAAAIAVLALVTVYAARVAVALGVAPGRLAGADAEDQAG